MKLEKHVQWKDFGVSLQALDAWARANLPSFRGISGDRDLRPVFVAETAEQIEADFQAFMAKWDEIDADHEMTTSYVSRADLKAREAARSEAIKATKLGMLEKTWASMNAVERKLYLGLDQEVSDEDLGL